MNKFLTVNDIRPDSVMSDQKAYMMKDIKKLVSGIYSFEEVKCPACNKNNYKKLYEKYNTTHVVCNECETQYVTPRLTEESIKKFYMDSDNYDYWADKVYEASYEARKNKIFIPRWELLFKLIKEKNLNDSFLEIGAGYGIFCKIIEESNFFNKVIGMEPTPALAKKLRSFGIDTIESGYEEVVLKKKMSVIASFEVIEHLHSPSKYLKWIFDNLVNGGCLYISCPNIKGFETKVLGKRSGTVDHQHINLFHPKSLKLLAKRMGYININIETPGELDCDLVEDYMKKKLININDIPEDYKDLYNSNNKDKLQKKIIKDKMSSHMIMTAFKPI